MVVKLKQSMCLYNSMEHICHISLVYCLPRRVEMGSPQPTLRDSAMKQNFGGEKLNLEKPSLLGSCPSLLFDGINHWHHGCSGEEKYTQAGDDSRRWYRQRGPPRELRHHHSSSRFAKLEIMIGDSLLPIHCADGRRSNADPIH